MSLTGRHIVVTRPEAQAGLLCAALRAEGAQPVLFPLLAIAPVVDDAPLLDVIQRLDTFDLAFFVSPNAVRHALDTILVKRVWPSAVQVATVGAGSERILRDYGFDKVIAPVQGFDTESVIALPEFSPDAIAGRKVLIFRGDGGREVLGQYLLQHGAGVEYVCVYHRYCPQVSARPLCVLADDRALDAIILTSSEGVRHLAGLLEKEAECDLLSTPVFVPHARIAGFCRDAGFRSIVLTPPGDEGVLVGLQQHFASQN